MEIEISRIRRDGGTQIRAAIDDKTVERYTEHVHKLPPVVVFFDGADYWLADGFHRVAAHERADRLAVEAHVREGTRRDAVLWSVSANKEHDRAGLPRTNADKRRAVETLLRDEEWCGWSDREIARRAAIRDHEMVTRLRAELAESASSPKTPAFTKGADGKLRPARRQTTADQEPVSEPPTAPAAPSVPAAPEQPEQSRRGRRPSVPISDSDRERILAWRSRGAANADMARVLGVTDNAVAAVSRTLDKDGRTPLNPIQARRVADLVAQIEGLALVSGFLQPDLMDEDTRRALVAGWDRINGTVGAIARNVKNGKV